METVFRIVAIIAIISSVATLISPMKMWYWSEGWAYRYPESVEPSERALMMTRVSAVGGIILSIALLAWLASR